MHFEYINPNENNRMLRIGFGKHNGNWFFRVDFWYFGIRIKYAKSI